MEQRLLPGPDAALFVGCKNYEQFYREVKKGVWPAPLPISSRPLRWDRQLLASAIDRYTKSLDTRPTDEDGNFVILDPSSEFN
jgi:predicted DNA-binding transcriptional regulator AlpA